MSLLNPAALHMMSSAPSPIASSSSSASSPPPRPRKRQRVDTFEQKEQRKEARAERNRQAAQISRDRRKAQFSALEQRVAELEAENEQLKRNTNVAPVMMVGVSEQERENAELRERIRILESNWASVTQGLAAQGLTALAPSLLSSNPATPSSTSSPASLPSPSDDSVSDHEPTRHLARVATAFKEASLQRVGSPILNCKSQRLSTLLQRRTTGWLPSLASRQRRIRTPKPSHHRPRICR